MPFSAVISASNFAFNLPNVDSTFINSASMMPCTASPKVLSSGIWSAVKAFFAATISLISAA